VTAAQARAAMAAHGVDFVDEHDARRVLLALLEQVADARRADADEHLDEIRAADRKERDVGLTGHRARQQRLARARRAHQQHALRDAPAQLLELLGLAQELDDLVQFFLRLVGAGHVLERDFFLGARRQLRAALAERQGLVPAALHLPHHENPEPDQERDRHPRQQHRRPRTHRDVDGLDGDLVNAQLLHEALGPRRRVGVERLGGFGRELARDLVAGEGHFADLPGLHRDQKCRKVEFVVALLEVRKVINRDNRDHDREPEDETLKGGTHSVSVLQD
jgi:hypothetical protein